MSCLRNFLMAGELGAITQTSLPARRLLSLSGTTAGAVLRQASFIVPIRSLAVMTRCTGPSIQNRPTPLVRRQRSWPELAPWPGDNYLSQGLGAGMSIAAHALMRDQRVASSD